MTTPNKSTIPSSEAKILLIPFFSNKFVSGYMRKEKINATKSGIKKLLAIINPKNKSVMNKRCTVALKRLLFCIFAFKGNHLPSNYLLLHKNNDLCKI